MQPGVGSLIWRDGRTFAGTTARTECQFCHLIVGLTQFIFPISRLSQCSNFSPLPHREESQVFLCDLPLSVVSPICI